MTQNPNSTDSETTTTQEEMIADSPLAVLFGDHAKTRMLIALADAYPQPLTAADVVDNAGLGSRQSWYDYRDDLLNTGLVVQTGKAGNSPLYSLAEPTDGDPRTDWLRNLRDATGAALRGDLDADNESESN